MEREAFLVRIAACLKDITASPSVSGVPDSLRGDSTVDHLRERFAAEFQAVGGRFVDVSTVEEAGEALRALIDEAGQPASIVTWDRGEYAEWAIDWLWNDPGARTLAGGSPESAHSFIDASIGITTVDYAVAETGSLIVTASATRSRSVSLVPRRHIALLRSDQIVRHLGEAFSGLGSREAFPSAAYVITGPSRSADIENDLTIGVHGPAEVVVICRR